MKQCDTTPKLSWNQVLPRPKLTSHHKTNLTSHPKLHWDQVIYTQTILELSYPPQTTCNHVTPYQKLPRINVTSRLKVSWNHVKACPN